MSLFGLFGKKQPQFDKTEGDPNVRAGLDLLTAGDGAALGAFYAGLAPADRVHFIDGVGLLSEIDAVLPDPGSHKAHACDRRRAALCLGSPAARLCNGGPDQRCAGLQHGRDGLHGAGPAGRSGRGNTWRQRAACFRIGR